MSSPDIETPVHIAEPWADPRPFREYARERQEGVSAFRGLVHAAALSVGFWAAVGIVVIFSMSFAS